MNADSIRQDEEDEDDASRGDNDLARSVQDLIRRVRRGQKSLESPAADIDTNALASQETTPTGKRSEKPPVHATNTNVSPTEHLTDGEATLEETLREWERAAEAQPDLPTRIGRFQIEGVLGRGGFGIVFLAQDPELDRRVALKIPRLDAIIFHDGPARFLREAKAAALLGHPNIVTVYEAGQIGAILFIAFEWINGPSLSQWLANQPALPAPRLSARLIMTLAEAVQHAHQRGIIHRDLKPQNVLIPAEPASSVDRAGIPLLQAKISDFGMARMLDDQAHTHTGAVVGTPTYMAPEQAHTDFGPIGVTTDVYGLGAVLYELLTGRGPFTGPTFAAVIRAVEQDDPVPPQRMNSAVPRDLEAICLKCLEKQPSRRYATAAELGADLERFLAGQPIRARRSTSTERAFRWIQRNSYLSLAILAAFLSLTIGLGFSLIQWRRANLNFQESEDQRSRAEKHLKQTELAIDQMLNEVVDVLEPIPQMEDFRARLLQRALEFEQTLVAAEADDPRMKLRSAAAQGRIAELQQRLGMSQEASQGFEHVLQLANAIQPTTEAERVDLQSLRLTTAIFSCEHLIARGQFAEAEKKLRQVVSQVVSLDPSRTDAKVLRCAANAFADLGRAQFRLQKLDEAQVSFQTSLRWMDAIPIEKRTLSDASSRSGNLIYVANTFAAAGKSEEAIVHFQNAIQEIDRAAAEHPESNKFQFQLVPCHVNLASIYLNRNEGELAAAEYATADVILQRLIADFPKAVRHQEARVSVLLGLGNALRKLNRPEEAQRRLVEAITGGTATVEKFGELAQVMDNLIRCYDSLGEMFEVDQHDLAKAREAYENQVAWGQRLLAKSSSTPSYHWLLSLGIQNIADLDVTSGNWEAAKDGFAQSLSEGMQALSAAPKDASFQTNVAYCHERLALIHCHLDDHPQALESARAIGRLDPEDPLRWIGACEAIVACEPRLFEREPAVRPETVQQYAERLLEDLRHALELGFRDTEKTGRLTSSRLLRDRPEAAQLRSEYLDAFRETSPN